MARTRHTTVRFARFSDGSNVLSLRINGQRRLLRSAKSNGKIRISDTPKKAFYNSRKYGYPKYGYPMSKERFALQQMHPSALLERAFRSFRRRTGATVAWLINETGETTSGASALWSHFLDAYYFRAQFPWLGESGVFGQDGLTYSLDAALRRYFVPRYPESKRAHEEAFSAIFKDSRTAIHPISAELKKSLLAAAEMVAQNENTMRMFLEGFTGDISTESLAKISDDELYTHVLNALVLYWELRAMGVAAE